MYYSGHVNIEMLMNEEGREHVDVMQGQTPSSRLESDAEPIEPIEPTK